MCVELRRFGVVCINMVRVHRRSAKDRLQLCGRKEGLSVHMDVQVCEEGVGGGIRHALWYVVKCLMNLL